MRPAPDFCAQLLAIAAFFPKKICEIQFTLLAIFGTHDLGF